MGTVEDYQQEFEMLIKRVTIPESLLKSFYISGLKLDLQCLLLRSNLKTLDEAFSLARAAETRFANLDIWEFLRFNPSTLGEDFFKARITEARFEIIAKEDKEHIAKGSLDADEYIGVEEVVGGGQALGIGEDDDLGDAATNGGDDEVESGDISILNSLIGHGSSRETLLCENMCAHVASEIQGLRRKVDLYVLMMMGMLRRQHQQQITTNAKIQRRLWDPGIPE
ncbi:hypothetical protein Tco_0282007 [Tanacetum coccineum]